MLSGGLDDVGAAFWNGLNLVFHAHVHCSRWQLLLTRRRNFIHVLRSDQAKFLQKASFGSPSSPKDREQALAINRLLLRSSSRPGKHTQTVIDFRLSIDSTELPKAAFFMCNVYACKYFVKEIQFFTLNESVLNIALRRAKYNPTKVTFSFRSVILFCHTKPYHVPVPAIRMMYFYT